MKRNNLYYLLLVTLLMHPLLSFSQTDTAGQKTDTSNAKILRDYREKLSEIDQQRIADSVQKTNLEAQLRSLKTTDNLKKEELQRKLQELEDTESRRLEEKKAQIDSLRLTARGYPVTGFFRDTLFLIYNKLGSFSPGERSAAISGRIRELAGDFRFRPDSLIAVSSENTVDLVFQDMTILSVTEDDALWNSASKNQLAEQYRKIISDAVTQYRKEINWITILKGIGLAVLVLALLVLLLKLAARLFRWTAHKIREQEGKLLKGIRIRNYTLFDAKRQVRFLVTLNNIVKWFVIVLIIYIALPVLFGIFPWTKNFAETLFGYILNPVKSILGSFLNYLPDLITIIVIVIVFRYILKGIRFLKNEIEAGVLTIPGFYPDWANPTYQIVRVLVLAFMFVVIFPYLPGSDSPVFKGVSVFLGFLFTFGSAGALSNIISGIVLTYMRLFKTGDRVKIGEVTGDVIEKTLLVTRIRTIKNEIVSIPNSTIMSNKTINYSSDAPDKGLIIHTTVTIGYDVAWKKMHRALIDAALKTNLVLKDPEPFVLQTSLDDFYVSYQVNAYTKEPGKQAIIYSNLHENIQDVCNERGIEIMSPHYRANRDGNTAAMPEEYVQKDYSKPGFDLNPGNADE